MRKWGEISVHMCRQLPWHVASGTAQFLAAREDSTVSSSTRRQHSFQQHARTAQAPTACQNKAAGEPIPRNRWQPVCSIFLSTQSTSGL